MDDVRKYAKVTVDRDFESERADRRKILDEWFKSNSSIYNHDEDMILWKMRGGREDFFDEVLKF